MDNMAITDTPNFEDILMKKIMDQPVDISDVSCYSGSDFDGDAEIEEVIKPSYYKLDPEPKDVIWNWGLNFNLGNAIKYISRAGNKPSIDELDDLRKAIQYLEFEICNRERMRKNKIKSKPGEGRYVWKESGIHVDNENN